MKHLLYCFLLWILVGLPIVQASAQGELQYADLGKCSLDSDLVIRDCRLAYRTFGELDPRKANAVLFPTWFRGTSEDLMESVGPGKMLDTTRYFVIAVDAFGNGLSSSPSNSPSQTDVSFPPFTIRDMVRAQRRFLEERFGISHLHAVVGVSMGGMQTFEWMVSYPEFMDKAAPILGSPRLASPDLLLWKAELRAIDVANEDAMAAVGTMHLYALSTPGHLERQTPPEDFVQFLEDWDAEFRQRFRAHDYASQLRAMMAHDVSMPFGDSMERAASAVRARILVVVASQDHMVNPTPALELAELLDAERVQLTGDCGHLAFVCEHDRVREAVDSFLRQ